MSIVLSAVISVNSGCWYIVFNILMLKVTMLKVILPLSKFGLISN